MEWSDYQRAIFAWFLSGSGNLVVAARAGSAKTTTSVEAVNRCSGLNVAMLAFNVKIGKRLREVVSPSVYANHFHSIGNGLVRNRFGRGIDVDEHRTRNMARASSAPREIHAGLARLVSAAKNSLSEGALQLDALIDRYDIEQGWVMPESLRANNERIDTLREQWERERRAEFVERACALLEASKSVKDTIDFDDQVWQPYVHGIARRRYDLVVVDEAQDLNPAMIEMAHAAIAPGGRIAVVGDRFQCIYGWNGASPELLELEGASTLPLPICYRCGSDIVKLARRIVPDIEPWDRAPTGSVLTCLTDSIPERAEPGDFVLSRTNADLVGVWLGLIRARKPAVVLGRDVAKNILTLVRRSESRSVDDLIQFVRDWREREVNRLRKAEKSTASVEDRAACVLALCEGSSSVREVEDLTHRMFGDDSVERVVLSTTHKAKGLERRRVFILGDTYCRFSGSEERNLVYVAATRAIEELVIAGYESGDRELARLFGTQGSSALSDDDDDDEEDEDEDEMLWLRDIES